MTAILEFYFDLQFEQENEEAAGSDQVKITLDFTGT